MNSNAGGRFSPTFPGAATGKLTERPGDRCSQTMLDSSRLGETLRSKSSTPPLCRSGPISGLRIAAKAAQRTQRPVETARSRSVPRLSPQLEPLVEQVRSAAKALTVQTITSIRGLHSPSDNDRKVCGAFLSLFSEIDDRIEATPSFKVLSSAFWEAMVNYTAKPGHVTQMVRSFPELLLSGKISDGKE